MNINFYAQNRLSEQFPHNGRQAKGWTVGQHEFCNDKPICRIPEDMVFTEEYSVRAARIAFYTLLGIQKKNCPVTPILLKAMQSDAPVNVAGTYQPQ